MLYAIDAYENTYEGLHGIESFCIVDCDSLTEAEHEAFNESLDVMESYSSVMEIIYDAASEEYERETDAWWDRVNDLMEENVAYEVYEIKDTKGKSIEELEDELSNDIDFFIEKYC